MAQLWIRGLSVGLVFLAVGGDNSCPAGAGASCKRGPDHVTTGEKGAVQPRVQPTADLISQEVNELKALVQLADERIEVLQELRSMMKTGVNLSLPDSHMKMLKEQLPLMSDLAIDDKAPTGSANDYLISKAIIPQEKEVGFIKWMTLKSQRTTGSSSASSGQISMPSVLLVAVQVDGTVRLFSAHGELFLTFSAGHDQPVTNLAVSQSQDEYNIVTADVGGLIRIHKVNVRSRRLTKEEKKTRKSSMDEKVSQFLGVQVNVTAQFKNEMQVPPGSDGERSQITALAMASQQGSKFVVVGDAEGKIGVFTKTGNFSARMLASETPGARIEGLYAHLSNLIYHTGYEWGFVHLAKLEVQPMECGNFQGRVTAVGIDSQQASKVMVSDEEGTVWVFNVKEKKQCKVEHRFPKGTTTNAVDLASIKGYTIALERAERGGDAAAVLAINMSHVGKSKDALLAAPSPVVWRQTLKTVRDWSVHKRYQAGDLLAFLSEDGHQIEVMELLMAVYTAPAADPFGGNFKLPLIAVAVVLVLGYQYMKNKGKGGGKGLDFSALKKGGGRKGGLAGLGGLGARRGGGGLGGLGGRKFK